MNGFVLVFWLSAGFLPALWAEEPTAATSKFRREVALFAERTAPKPGGILLVGSSTFKRWTNAMSDLAPLPVTNRAFGGSQTSHQLMFFNEVVPPCRPSLIVWYCGSNDIKGKKEPQAVLKKTEEWLAKVKEFDPSVRVLLVSIHRCPQKWKDGQIEAVDAVNRGYEGLAQRREGVTYVDVNPALEETNGKPRVELYVEDGLHLNPDGYRQMGALLKPAMTKVWPSKSSG